MTKEELAKRMEYNGLTGEFTWVNGKNIGKKVGCVNASTGYIVTALNKRQYTVHRLAWLYMTGLFPENDIDHIDGNRSNNKWENLRTANHAENMANSAMPCNNTSGHKSVFRADKKWIVRISVNGKRINFGRYKTKEEANFVAMTERKNLHKEFANHG